MARFLDDETVLWVLRHDDPVHAKDHSEITGWNHFLLVPGEQGRMGAQRADCVPQIAVAPSPRPGARQAQQDPQLPALGRVEIVAGTAHVFINIDIRSLEFVTVHDGEPGGSD